MFIQIRTGASKANTEEKQFLVYNQSTLSLDRWLQNAQMGRISGVPIGDHRVLGPKLLRLLQEQGRSYSDRERQDEYKIV